MAAAQQAVGAAVDAVVARAEREVAVGKWLVWLRSYAQAIANGLKTAKVTDSYGAYIKWTMYNSETLQLAPDFRPVDSQTHRGWVTAVFRQGKRLVRDKRRARMLLPMLDQALDSVEVDARGDTGEALEALEVRTDQLANTAQVLADELQKARDYIEELERERVVAAERELKLVESTQILMGKVENLGELLEMLQSRLADRAVIDADNDGLPDAPPSREEESISEAVEMALDAPLPPPLAPAPPPPPPPTPLVSNPAALNRVAEETAKDAREQADKLKQVNGTEDLFAEIRAGKTVLRAVPETFTKERALQKAERQGDDSMAAVLARRVAIAGDDDDENDDDENDESGWELWGDEDDSAVYGYARFTPRQLEHLLDATGGDVSAAAQLGEMLCVRGQRTS